MSIVPFKITALGENKTYSNAIVIAQKLSWNCSVRFTFRASSTFSEQQVYIIGGGLTQRVWGAEPRTLTKFSSLIVALRCSQKGRSNWAHALWCVQAITPTEHSDTVRILYDKPDGQVNLVGWIFYERSHRYQKNESTLYSEAILWCNLFS